MNMLANTSTLKTGLPEEKNESYQGETDEDLLAHLPLAPCRRHHPEWYSESFAFSFLMLPSVNRKYGKGQHNSIWVRKEYARQEQREARRIALQRTHVGWTCAPSDRYFIHYHFLFKSMREDIHNPIKPTCDILADGIWVSQGKNRPKRWIPYGGLIWNDDRVFDEYTHKEVNPKMTSHWARLTIYKFHHSDAARFPIADVLYEQAKPYQYSLSR